MKKKLLSCLVFFLSGIMLQAQQQGSIRLRAIDPSTSNLYFMELHTNNDKITGTYVEQENPDIVYAINAAVQDNKIRGRLTDNTGILSFRFTLTYVRDVDKQEGLQLTLDNPVYASLMPQLIFKAYTNEAPASQPSAAPGKATADFDRRIVGKWVNVERYSSGDFWSTTRQTMVIDNNGMLHAYEPETSVNTGDSYVNSSPGKLLASNRIFTRNNQIYSLDNATGKQVLVANYTIDGNTLLTVTVDGERQLWQK